MATAQRIGGRPRGREVGDSASGWYGRSGAAAADLRRRGGPAMAAVRGATALVLEPAEQLERPRRATRSDRLSATRAERSSATRAERSSATRAERPSAAGYVGSPPAEVRAPLTVAPPAPVATARAPFVSLVLVVFIVGVVGILLINTKINENAFHLHDLRRDQTHLDQQEEVLRDELAQMESPNSLAVAARRLGLVRADAPPTYLRLPDGRTLDMPQPAGPGNAPAGHGDTAAAPANAAAGRPGR